VALFKDFAANCRLSAIAKAEVPRDRIGRMINGSRALHTISRALRAGRDMTPQEQDILVQLSYIGRALPKGRVDKEGQKAQMEHVKNLTSPAEPLPPGRREELRAFAKKWAERHLDAWDQRPEFDPTSGSCLEFSRKKGGMAEFLRDRLHRALKKKGLWPPPRYIKKLTSYPVVEDEASSIAHAALRDELIEEFKGIIEGFTYPEAQVLTISERGYKSRIVTKSNGAIVALGHHIRRWLTRGTRSDPSIREVLAGDHREAVESLLAPDHGSFGPSRWAYRDEGDQWILSADLKTATDLIGSETYEAIAEGIMESTPGKTMPEWAKHLFKVCIGPQRLIYPDLGVARRSKRGALMGLPTTWPLLCLANLAWWDSSRPVRICGDDLVAKAPKLLISRYESRAKDSGAKFSSKAKHMCLQGGGVFTEEVFFTTGVKRVVSEGPLRSAKWVKEGHARRNPSYLNTLERWSEAFPLRGIIGTMKSDLTGTDAPYWAAIGPALERMMAERSPNARRKILLTLQYSHPELRAFLSDVGLAGLFHVPRQFGGVGIPTAEMWDFHPPEQNHAQKWVLQTAVALAAGAKPGENLTILSRPWAGAIAPNPIRENAGRIADSGLSGRYNFVKAGPDTEFPKGTLIFPGTVTDLQEKVAGNVARDLYFLSDVPLVSSQVKHRNAYEVARNLQRRLVTARRELISSRGGWILKSARKAAKRRQEREEPPATPKRSPEEITDQETRFNFVTPARSGVKPGLVTFLANSGMYIQMEARGEVEMAAEGEVGKRGRTWSELLQQLKEKEDQRVATLRPGTERDMNVPFERLEELTSKTLQLSNQAGGIPLWGLPFREWPGRPAKEVFKHLFGPGGGE